MVGQKFGKSDPDMGNRFGKGKTKELSDKPGLKASAKVPTTGMIGGIANRKSGPSAAEGSGGYPAFKKGGKAKR
jgi:hypothetical protein